MSTWRYLQPAMVGEKHFLSFLHYHLGKNNPFVCGDRCIMKLENNTILIKKYNLDLNVLFGTPIYVFWNKKKTVSKKKLAEMPSKTKHHMRSNRQKHLRFILIDNKYISRPQCLIKILIHKLTFEHRYTFSFLYVV